MGGRRGQNIITLGDGNQVDAKFEQLSESLATLRRAILESDELDEKQKLESVVNIDTLQIQLGLQSPDRTIVERLWESVNRAASVAGLVQAAGAVAPFISRLLGNG